MNRRRAIAILALLGALDAGYLLLAKLGITGPLSCSISRGCEMVNMSEYSVFLGIPVSAIGLAGYLAILALAAGLVSVSIGRSRDKARIRNEASKLVRVLGYARQSALMGRAPVEFRFDEEGRTR